MHYILSKSTFLEGFHIVIPSHVHCWKFWNVSEALKSIVWKFSGSTERYVTEKKGKKKNWQIHSTKSIWTTFYLLCFSSQCITLWQTLNSHSFTLRSLFLSWFLCSLPPVTVWGLAGHWRCQSQGWSQHSRYPVINSLFINTYYNKYEIQRSYVKEK